MVNVAGKHVVRYWEVDIRLKFSPEEEAKPRSQGTVFQSIVIYTMRPEHLTNSGGQNRQKDRINGSWIHI